MLVAEALIPHPGHSGDPGQSSAWLKQTTQVRDKLQNILQSNNVNTQKSIWPNENQIEPRTAPYL